MHKYGLEEKIFKQLKNLKQVKPRFIIFNIKNVFFFNIEGFSGYVRMNNFEYHYFLQVICTFFNCMMLN